jgi:hypothetical protein
MGADKGSSSYERHCRDSAVRLEDSARPKRPSVIRRLRCVTPLMWIPRAACGSTEALGFALLHVKRKPGTGCPLWKDILAMRTTGCVPLAQAACRASPRALAQLARPSQAPPGVHGIHCRRPGGPLEPEELREEPSAKERDKGSASSDARSLVLCGVASATFPTGNTPPSRATARCWFAVSTIGTTGSARR